MSKLVSIVIPIYNVEDFLVKCLGSIKNQSYSSIEVLLIDDGSKDNSRKICHNFIKIDDRFKYFYQNNSGVSAARNNGIRNAKGEYIIFVDGDDYLDKRHVEKMVNKITKFDLVISGRKNVTEKGIRDIFQSDRDIIFSQKMLIDQILKPGIVYSFPWNKMYKMNILTENTIQFDETLDYGEDLVFNIQYALLTSSSVLTSDSTYNYVYRESSVSNQLNVSSLKKKVTDLLSIKKTIDMLSNRFMEEKIFLNKRIVIEGAKYIRLMYMYNFEAFDILFYKKIVKDSYREVKKLLSSREKLVYFGNLRFPKIMNRISDIKN